MANKKITELTELTTPAGADLFAIVDDTDTTTKKVTVSNLMTQAPVQTADISGFATTVSLGNHESLTSSVHGISAFGATLVDDADAATARTTLGVDAAGTDNSTDVTLTGTPDYITISGQVITRNQIDLSADVTGSLPHTSVSGLGTAATSASTDFSPAFFTIVSETTTSRTLSNSDNGKVIVCSNSAATTVTIPSGLTSGFGCTVVQNGTGVVSIEGSGATVYGFGNKTATAGQYGSINVYNVGTNAYVLEGDTQSPPFVNGFSLDFDGSNDYVDAGSSPSGLTIEGLSVWFRPDSTFTTSGPLQYLLGFGGSDIGIALGGDWFGPVTNEVLTVTNTNHLWSYAGSGVSVSESNWHHLGIRWESSSSSTNSGNAGYDIYLDGSKVGNAFGTYSSGIGSKITTQRITVGARNRNGTISFYFDGIIDELGIFTSAVSESDLLAMYNSGSGAIDLTSYSPGLWWRMGDSDGGTGSTITDLGSGSNNGTINGATFSTTVP